MFTYPTRFHSLLTVFSPYWFPIDCLWSHLITASHSSREQVARFMAIPHPVSGSLLLMLTHNSYLMAKPSRAPLTVNGTSSINGEANGKVSTLPRQTKLYQFIECHRPFAGNRNNERIKWKSIEPNKQSAELISCIFINTYANES